VPRATYDRVQLPGMWRPVCSRTSGAWPARLGWCPARRSLLGAAISRAAARVVGHGDAPRRRRRAAARRHRAQLGMRLASCTPREVAAPRVATRRSVGCGSRPAPPEKSRRPAPRVTAYCCLPGVRRPVCSRTSGAWSYACRRAAARRCGSCPAPPEKSRRPAPRVPHVQPSPPAGTATGRSVGCGGGGGTLAVVFGDADLELSLNCVWVQHGVPGSSRPRAWERRRLARSLGGGCLPPVLCGTLRQCGRGGCATMHLQRCTGTCSSP
jgi:hypothetical protein